MKRYELVHLENDDSFLCDYEDNRGDWVKWEDARDEIERLRTALVGAYSLWSSDQGDGCETANKMADIINAALEPKQVPQIAPHTDG